MDQINMRWFWGILKTNKYSLFSPLTVGVLLFWILKDILSFLPLFFIFCVLQCLCIFVWFWFLIKIPRFNKDEIGILVVFPTVPQLYDEIHLISEDLSRLISGLSTEKRIRIKSTRNNLFLNHDQDIQTTLERSRATLIVYAELRHDRKNNDEICHFRQIQFLTRFPKGVLSLQKDIERDFRKIRVGYFLKDTLGNRNQVVENVSILSTFTLSNTLRAYGNFLLAEKLLLELRRKLPQARNSIAIKKNIAICRLLRGRDLYESQIYMDGKFHIKRDILEKIRSLLISAYSFYEYGDIFLLLSVVNFLLGEEKKSWASLRRANSRSPKGNYVANFSYSFLFCFKGNIEDARRNLEKFYNDPEALPIHPSGLWHMINFTEYVLSVYPEKYCLYFHLSYVYRLVNFNMALEMMQKFLDKCSADSVPIQFIELANQEIAFYKSEITTDL